MDSDKIKNFLIVYIYNNNNIVYFNSFLKKPCPCLDHRSRYFYKMR